MTFQELTTPFNLIWPPVAYTIVVSVLVILSRKLKHIHAPIQTGHVLRIFLQGVVLEAVFLAVVFVDPALLGG